MSERVFVKQNFTPVELSQHLTKVKDLKAEGYRFGQACATVEGDNFEIIYSFDKAYELTNELMEKYPDLEMIAGMKKPTVSLVLGGGHSIGIPLAVCTKKSFITPTASMTVHPVRMTGLVVGAPKTFRYFQRIQEQIVEFVSNNSRISRENFENYMMATGEMATDVGTILYGKEAVSSGLIDRLGGLNDALSTLHRMIEKNKQQKDRKK